MNSKKETVKPKKRPAGNHTAAEKVQAVLAVWTERVKPAEVMRSLGISYVTLQQWQERAMEGMLQRVNLTDGAALSPRLKALLTKRQLAAGKEKLSARLAQIQEVAPSGESRSTA